MLAVLEIVCLVLIVLLVVTQILIPGFRGLDFFPMFKKTAQLEKELTKVQQEIADSILAQEVEALKKTVTKK